MKPLQIISFLVVGACSVAISISTMTNLFSLIEIMGLFIPFIIMFTFGIIGIFMFYLFVVNWNRIFLK